MEVTPNGDSLENQSSKAKESERINASRKNDELLPCCQETIDQHAAHNAMMVCSSCKQIIKCFADERSYQNYRRFCASRHRRILATSYSGINVVVFNSYDTYST